MNAPTNYTNQNYNFAIIQAYKMKIRGLPVLAIFLIAGVNIHAQVQKDTLPVFLADSMKVVYIYADTGAALNRIDQQGRRQGLWEKRYPDGHLRYKGHFWDNEPEGVFKNYYDEGDSLEAIRVYSDGGQSAYAHLFYPTGALYAEGKYINEKEDSIWKFYDELQRLIRKDQYKNGKKDGRSVVFYSGDGHVMEVKNWKNDSAEGHFQQYYDEGGIMEEGTYVHDKLQDTFYIYNMDGTIAKRGMYLNDMHEGNWISYSDGVPKDTLIYHLGRCLNCDKYRTTPKQADSLKLHYQDLQQRLENPSDDPDQEARPPGDDDQQ
jgi:antitoxin component YwqK of YwqJK toxin-antitoxin module